MLSTQRFFIISDPQIGNETQVQSLDIKTNIVLQKISPDDIVIIPGDLTEKGVGQVNNPIHRYLAYCACFRKEGDIPEDNQFRIFREKYLHPLDEKSKDVFFCNGNHDTYTQKWWGEQDVAKFIKKRYGGLHYMKKCNGIFVFSLSIYPNKKRIKWFESKLAKTTEPFVVFFHYNIEGPFSDWWSDDLKSMFLSVLQKHKERCVFIAEGHYHSSYFKYLKDFLVVNGAGNAVVSIEVQTDENHKIIKIDPKLLDK